MWILCCFYTKPVVAETQAFAELFGLPFQARGPPPWAPALRPRDSGHRRTPASPRAFGRAELQQGGGRREGNEGREHRPDSLTWLEGPWVASGWLRPAGRPALQGPARSSALLVSSLPALACGTSPWTAVSACAGCCLDPHPTRPGVLLSSVDFSQKKDFNWIFSRLHGYLDKSLNLYFLNGV